MVPPPLLVVRDSPLTACASRPRRLHWDITFNTAAGTTVQAASGNGVQLNATGGASIFNTVNGTVTSTVPVLGTGLIGTAVGAGVVNFTVGATGVVNGTGAGLVGTSVNGDVNLIVNGTVNQTAAVGISPNFVVQSVGVGGISTGSGNVNITTAVGSNVTQVGNAVTEGTGVIASTFLGSGNATVAVNGNVSARGIGAWAVSNSGTATTTVSGNVLVTGNGPSIFVDTFFPLATVGVLAQSVTGSATANLFGGNVGSAALDTSPDIGVAASILGLGATTNAVVNVGNGVATASTVFANEVGLYAINLGSGASIINRSRTATVFRTPRIPVASARWRSPALAASGLMLGSSILTWPTAVASAAAV